MNNVIWAIETLIGKCWYIEEIHQTREECRVSKRDWDMLYPNHKFRMRRYEAIHIASSRQVLWTVEGFEQKAKGGVWVLYFDSICSRKKEAEKFLKAFRKTFPSRYFRVKKYSAVEGGKV